jgi:phenylpropionate dioxygenase-like ring-hydroxylating dioxygenase large terminal subunit
MNIAGTPTRSTARDWQEPKVTLPAWTYCSDEFLQLEREHLLLASPQIVGHVNDMPNPGDYLTLDFLGERALVVRGDDGDVRAFHNVCRHRAAAVVRGQKGSCPNGLRCLYHGWHYALDGQLKAVPADATFPGLDKREYGLKPLGVEIWMGFVFVMFRSGGSSIAERMRPYETELRACRLDEMVPDTRSWDVETGSDWKNVMDNYLEGYHVAVGHPGLYRLFGTRYDTEVQPGGVCKAIQWLRDKPSPVWSERAYQSILPEIGHLPADRRRAWAYYTLLPNASFDIYPEFMDFFQVVPTAAGRSRVRGRCYRLPELDGRAHRAARWLNYRISTEVQREDNDLTRSVQAGLATGAYSTGILSEKEECVAALHDLVRSALPVARLPEKPAPGTMAEINAGMM